MSMNATVGLAVDNVGSGVPRKAIACQTRTAITHSAAKSKAMRNGKLRSNELSGEELKTDADMLCENDSQ